MAGTAKKFKENNNPSATQDQLYAVSYRLFRKWIGILGLSIPLLLPLIAYLFSGCCVVQESISHYYYTVAGDVFVALLSCTGIFLITYPGKGRIEDYLTNIAGVCAVIVAILPTGYEQFNLTCTYPNCFNNYPFISILHLTSAGSFFLILGYVAIFQFPENTNSNIGRTRRHFYRWCGIIMWACILTLSPMIFSDYYGDFLSEWKLVFILEVIMLLSFGTCWLVKGSEPQS